MSDLRTRIAAAISSEWSELTIDESWEDGLLVLADAVIRQLGLRQERQQGPYNHMYRYVTEFESNYE